MKSVLSSLQRKARGSPGTRGMILVIAIAVGIIFAGLALGLERAGTAHAANNVGPIAGITDVGPDGAATVPITDDGNAITAASVAEEGIATMSAESTSWQLLAIIGATMIVLGTALSRRQIRQLGSSLESSLFGAIRIHTVRARNSPLRLTNQPSLRARADPADFDGRSTMQRAVDLGRVAKGIVLDHAGTRVPAAT